MQHNIQWKMNERGILHYGGNLGIMMTVGLDVFREYPLSAQSLKRQYLTWAIWDP